MKTPGRIILIGIIILGLTSNSFIMAQNDYSSSVIGIGVVVSDLDESLTFYKDVLGMKETGGFNLDGDFGRTSGLTDGLPLSVTTLKLEDSPDASSWKLLSYGKDAPDPLPRYVEDIIGMRYITLNVTSMKPFLKRIKKNKVKMLGDTPILLGDGERSFVLIQDPNGILIELIGPMD